MNLIHLITRIWLELYCMDIIALTYYCVIQYTTLGITIEDMFISYKTHNDCGIVCCTSNIFTLWQVCLIYIFIFFPSFQQEASDGETPEMHHSHSADGGSSTREHCTQFFLYIFNSTSRQSVICSTYDKKIHIKKYFYFIKTLFLSKTLEMPLLHLRYDVYDSSAV